jgi:hypothetical protein
MKNSSIQILTYVIAFAIPSRIVIDNRLSITLIDPEPARRIPQAASSCEEGRLARLCESYSGLRLSLAAFLAPGLDFADLIISRIRFDGFGFSFGVFGAGMDNFSLPSFVAAR